MSVALFALCVALADPPAPKVDEAVARLSVLPDDPGTLTLLVENDILFTLDRHYSSGVDVLYTASRAGTPSFMHRIGRLFTADGDVHATFGGGHNIYTPRSIILKNLDDRDRPFAGFLYAIAGVQAITPRHADDLTLTLGIIGPAALGPQVQRVIHAAIGPTPRRWDTQLSNEGVGVLSYQHTWRVPVGIFGDLETEIFPHVSAAAGNVYTYAGAGLTLRFGNHMPLDYGPTRVLPGIQGSGVFTQTHPFGWYYFIGGEVRGVARNIFLDGNTWATSRSVPKNPLVVDAQFGWALVWRNTRLTVTHVMRSREFERQTKPDFFASVALAIHM